VLFRSRSNQSESLTIDTNNLLLNGYVQAYGTNTGSQWTLSSNLNLSNHLLFYDRGIFNANTSSVTAAGFKVETLATSTISLGSGTWTITGLDSLDIGSVWNMLSTTGLTFNKNTANIVLSSTGTGIRTFKGGGLSYNKLTIGGSTGTSTTKIQDNNTFTEIDSTKTVAHTIEFAADSTTTVGDFNVNGSSGSLVTLTSSSTSNFTLTKTGGGTVNVSYLDISNSTATPSSTWYAANSTDSGNNSGWIFSAAPTGNMLFVFM
jgi:hypothetical protein